MSPFRPLAFLEKDNEAVLPTVYFLRMSEMETTIENQEALRGMQDRIMARFEEVQRQGTLAISIEAFRRLVVGLRLCAVCPSASASKYNAWLSLSRAWRELGLPEAELDDYQKRVNPALG
jgi:hypothetical protein